MTQTIRKSTLALILAVLTVSAGHALTHPSIFPPAPKPDGGGTGGNGGDPNPTCQPAGSCLVDIH
jgi:hypothetical protein